MADQPHSISDTVEVSFQIACPCGQVLTVGPTMVGQAVRCPRCSTLLEVPSPDESALNTGPPSIGLQGDTHWRTALPTPRRDNFIDEELKRDAERQPPSEPEKRHPIDPTPLLAVVGGTVLLLLLIGMGFYALDQYVHEFKTKSGSSTHIESKDRASGERIAPKRSDR